MSLIRTYYIFGIFFVSISLFLVGETVHAATLRVSPETGVYTAGSTFTVQVLMNTQSKPVNAADAQLSYNPKELSVVSVGRSSSVFNLWTQEPTFSAQAGTISFGGGSPTGYTGGSGNIITITFRALAAGAPKVQFKSGSVLAADGQGTNVLTSMNGGTYTIEAKSDAPPPEYIPPVNTPPAPKVTSSTHPDQTAWYKEHVAKLSWDVPREVTQVRTLLDQNPSSIPTRLFEEPISSREITDLPEGTSYFHIQHKSDEGWGRVTHFRINVDSEEPKSFTISEATTETYSPTRTFVFTTDDTSPIVRYTIQLDGGEAIIFNDVEQKKQFTLDNVSPGEHTLVVEAFDSAGNSRIDTYTFEVTAFDPPRLTEYPERFNTGVVPAFRGESRPGAIVTAFFEKDGTVLYTTTAVVGEDAKFTLVPETSFEVGVYDLTLNAALPDGAQSLRSNPVRIVVEEPGYIAIGSFMVKVLSVLVPLVVLTVFLIFGSWFLWWRLHRSLKRVMKETIEAEEELAHEFDGIIALVHKRVSDLRELRKGKATKAEEALFTSLESDLRAAQKRIGKEITDIEHIVE